MAKYFSIPFAMNGDRKEIPTDKQDDGSISFDEGYGADYEKNKQSDPTAKDISRQDFNGVLHDITEAIGDIQRSGIATWTNEISYNKGATIIHNGAVYTSTINANKNEPPHTSWSSLDLSVYRKKDDLLFNGMMQVQATDDVGTGVFLLDKEGNPKGQMTYNSGGLQFAQHDLDGTSKTYTLPPVSGELLTDSALHYFTPEMFGAKGDGVTDDLLPFRAMVDASRKESKPIRVEKGLFKLNGFVDISCVTIYSARDVVYDFKDNPSAYMFRANGTIKNTVGVSKVQGNTITTSETHSFKVGDTLILKSLTRCDNPADATEEWCLGAGTANASPVYFGEPCTVKGVTPTTITLTSNIIFKDSYNKVEDGVVASLQGVEWGTANFLGFPTILFSETKHQTGFHGDLLHSSNVEINGSMSKFSSQIVRVSKSINTTIKGTNKRPVDWVLDKDHSLYNSWKTLSCWYSVVDVVEYNGAQSFDQSYLDLPSIGETIKINSYNPREQGCTSHGMSYMSKFDVTVVGNARSGMSNRARFSDIKLHVIGDNSSDSWGLNLCDWGMTDVKADVFIKDSNIGVRFGKSYSAVSSTAKVLSVTITGMVMNCDTVYLFDTKTPPSISLSSAINLNCSTKGCYSIIRTNTESAGWNKRHLTGSHFIVESTKAIINLGTLTTGNTIASADFIGAGVNQEYLSIGGSVVADSPYPRISIDYSTVFFDKGNQFNLTPTLTYGNAQSTLNDIRLLNTSQVIITSNSASNSTLTLSDNELIFPRMNPVTYLTINAGIRVEVGGTAIVYDNRGTGQKSATILRTSENTYYVY